METKQCIAEQYAFFLHRNVGVAINLLLGSGWKPKGNGPDTYELTKEGCDYKLIIKTYRADGAYLVKSITAEG